MKTGVLFALVWVMASALVLADSSPLITNFTVNGQQKNIRFAPVPATKAYSILETDDLNLPFTPQTNFAPSPYYVTTVFNVVSNITNTINVTNYEWRLLTTVPSKFFRVQATPMSTNETLTAIVLNRLAYGQTPDDLDTLLATSNGAQNYINEQLASELMEENVANSHANLDTIEAKFADPNVVVTVNHASLADLRAWHTLRAVGAKRQLLEILLQFFENHFVTQYTKSVDYFDPFYDNGTLQGRFATQFEYWENQKWRAVLLNSTGTFYDLLKASVESPAMIIYLDTVESRGDRNNIPNENYARELLELFTVGVDNGYDQTDITLLSRAWTGWRMEIVDSTNVFNPFAARTTNNLPGVTNNFTATSNLLGCWAFNYKGNFHYTNSASTVIFSNKFVPARFGSPYTTKLYGTNLQAGLYQLSLPRRQGTNGIQDGYDVIRHLADLPFTQEYMSVKLCRLFVHDDFELGNDFTSSNLSPETQLIKDCMTAWENGSPKGQIRDVLRVIFNSDLFRNQTAAAQKVKTPLEFVVSTVRSLRAMTNGTFTPNSFSADTDGYAFSIPMTRMGGMNLFDRGDPDGYPESAAGWISAGTLAERVRFAQSFCIASASGISGHFGNQSSTTNDAGNCISRPVDLLRRKLAVADQRNATKVVDYFLGLIYPGEGAGNLEPYRQAAITFLNTADNGATSAFSGLSVSSSAGSTYDTRVRGMVGMLLSMQLFQEQ